jgi:5-methylcytosine-specific restriction endonuclease McrA
MATRCKDCKRNEHRNLYASRLQCYSPVSSKVCNRCGIEKPAAMFHRQTAAKDGLTTYCIECSKSRASTYYTANREKMIRRAWVRQRANPEAARAARIATRNNERVKRAGATGSFTAEEWRDLLDYYCHRCAYCLRPENEAGLMTSDHMVPLSRGGAGSIDNIAPACERCNGSKRDKTVLEFICWQEAVAGILSCAQEAVPGSDRKGRCSASFLFGLLPERSIVTICQ